MYNDCVKRLQALFDEWFIAIYNVVYTSTPVLVLGFLEQVGLLKKINASKCSLAWTLSWHLPSIILYADRHAGDNIVYCFCVCNYVCLFVRRLFL